MAVPGLSLCLLHLIFIHNHMHSLERGTWKKFSY